MIKEYFLKNGDSTFGYNIYLGIDPVTNKEVRKRKRGFKTKRDAEIAEARALIKFEEKGFASAPKQMTYQEVFNLWWESEYKLGVKGSTLMKTKRTFDNHILPEFGELIISKVSPQFCQQQINQLREKLVHYRVVKNYAARVFDYAFRMDIIKSNPFDKTVTPKRMKRVDDSKFENYYNREELTEFLACVKKDLSMRWYAYFRLLAYTGMRLSEGLALYWNDIDFVESTVNIEKALARTEQGVVLDTTKTAKSTRVISLDDETLKILKKWKHQQSMDLLQQGINVNSNDEQLVFNNTSNQFTNPSQPYARMKSIQNKNNLRTIVSIHGFRHTHISLLFEAGAELKTVQDRVGHTDVHTTMNIYAHVTKEAEKKSVQKFVDYMEN